MFRAFAERNQAKAFLELCSDYPLKKLCKVLGLSFGDGHYLRDHRVEHPLNEIRDDLLRLKIKEIFEKSYNTYGKRRIRVVLRKMSITVSERKVSQLMAEMRLVSRHVEYHWIAPHDNAVSEAFFATFKKEFVRKRIFASEEQLYDEIDSYIHFYNEERIHTSIGMSTPCGAEAEILEPVVKILD